MLGGYELIRRIATGGMAEVYLARSLATPGAKPVVIKRMLSHLARDRQFVQMFLSEARIATRVDHPNVVRVEDVGIDGGDYFLVMEYVHGTDLLRIMRALARQGGAIPIEIAAAITARVCAGLACAHELVDERGKPLALVHRDVSLPNILVSYDGAVKLADFGVAQVADRERTRAGVLKGKFGYMSPEQARGKPLDLRSDIFSLGIVLYEMTTGERAFAGDNDFRVLERVAACQITPPSQHIADYPIELEAIVMTALQRERDDRYQTARDMQVDLEAYLCARPATAASIAELVTCTVPDETEAAPVRASSPRLPLPLPAPPLVAPARPPSPRAVPRSDRPTVPLTRAELPITLATMMVVPRLTKRWPLVVMIAAIMIAIIAFASAALVALGR